MDWIHLNGQSVQSFYQEFTKDGHNTFHSTGDPSENKIHHLITELIHMQQGANARTDFQSSVAIHELLNELILQKYQLDFEEEDIPLTFISLSNTWTNTSKKRSHLIN